MARRRSRPLLRLLPILALMALLLLPASPALATSFTVNDTRDLPDLAAGGACDADAAAGDQCTLRAAIQLANASAGPHTITLPEGTYTLDRVGTDDNANSGDLDITQNITISGGGAKVTFVQASTSNSSAGIDRVFHVRPGGALTLTGVTVRNGKITGEGGGIFNDGTLTLDGVVVSGNQALSGGGLSLDGGTTTVRNSTISGNVANSAFAAGAGVAFPASGATATFTNVTISGNQAISGMGGGLRVEASNTVTLANVTVTGNSADDSAGGILKVGGSTVTLRNTIVANNTAPSSPNCQNTPTSAGFNLVFPSFGCGLAAATNDQINQNPLLGPLADNGGQTPTHRPQAGSAAIGRGNTASPGSGGNACEATDQRGVDRPFDGNGDGQARCDIGAVEVGTLISNIANQQTPEDTAVGPIAFTIADASTPLNDLTLSGSSSNATLVPEGNVVIGGSGANRTVTVLPARDKVGTATITVAVNGGVDPVSDSFVVTVGGTNDAPTISDIPDQVTQRNTPLGPIDFTVGDTETPADQLRLIGSSSNTTLVPTQNIVFGGSGANRTVTVTPAANQSGTATITIAVLDDGRVSTAALGGGAFTSFELTVDARPTISNIPNQTTPESVAKTVSFTVQDVDTPLGNLILSATSSNTALVRNASVTFGGSGANRSATITPVAGQHGTATITITVSDGIFSASDSFMLTVGTNAAPTISDITDVQIAEDAPNGTGPIQFTIGDTDSPLASLTVSGSSSNTALVPNANIVFGGSDANRTVTVTPLANKSGTATITVTVSDGGGIGRDTFVLTVGTVNDLPTISNIPDQTTPVNTAKTVSFTVADVEDLSTLRLTAVSSDQTLVPNTTTALTFGGAGANRTLRVTPASNQAGRSTTITVTVDDNKGGTAQDSFVLTVQAPPTLEAVANQSTPRNTPKVVNLTVGDPDTDPNALTLSASSSSVALVPNANITFGGSGTARTATITPTANQSGMTTITITVSDGALTARRSFTLLVNNPPTISNIGNQTVAQNGQTAPIPFTVGDTETAAGSLTLTAISSDTTKVPVAGITFGGSGANRTVRVKPALSQTGTVTITVTVRDAAGLTASDSFDLTIT